MFDPAIITAADNNREVDLTTFGRKTGTASRRTIWINAEGDRVYIRSGRGLGRDWTRNVLANGRAILHVAGQDVPVRVRHVTDAEEARASNAASIKKYNVDRVPSKGDEPLTLPEQATFELLPEG